MNAVRNGMTGARWHQIRHLAVRSRMFHQSTYAIPHPQTAIDGVPRPDLIKGVTYNAGRNAAKRVRRAARFG
jgi:hypothetical protein